jgi:hypothetical protein
VGEPGYGETAGAADAEAREPCPHCGDGVRAGARKCPHCRAYLDAALAADRRRQVDEQVDYILESEELTESVKNYMYLAGAGSFVLFFLGPLLGPAMLGYALYYQHRARLLQMPELPRIRLLFAFAGLWTATGIIGIAAIWYAASYR